MKMLKSITQDRSKVKPMKKRVTTILFYLGAALLGLAIGLFFDYVDGGIMIV